MSRFLWLVCLLLAFVGSPVQAAVINAVDTGYYSQTDGHIPDNSNYGVGWAFSEFRNWFVFDLSAYGAIESAVVRAYLAHDSETAAAAFPGLPAGGYFSSAVSMTWQLFDVVTPITDLTTAARPGATFDDLGSGELLGEVVVSAADEGSHVTVELNAAGLASLGAAHGLWAVGGAMLGPAPASISFAFASSHQHVDVSLDIQEVPAPGPLALVLPGLLGIALRFTRQRSGHTGPHPAPR